eukprot:363429-Chlamydomonas_euryale.AAC.29
MRRAGERARREREGEKREGGEREREGRCRPVRVRVNESGLEMGIPVRNKASFAAVPLLQRT